MPKLLTTTASYQLYQFIRSGKASCSHGLIAGEEIMLFDPSRNIDFYIDFAKEKNVRICKTFETHLQADYIAGSRMIAERTGAEFLANANDFTGAKIEYTRLENNKTYGFTSDGPSVEVLFTPGHTQEAPHTLLTTNTSLPAIQCLSNPLVARTWEERQKNGQHSCLPP